MTRTGESGGDEEGRQTDETLKKATEVVRKRKISDRHIRHRVNTICHSSNLS